MLQSSNRPMSYHKGEFCHFVPTLCQEGYCADCMLFLTYSSSFKFNSEKQKVSFNTEYIDKKILVTSNR